MDFYERLYQLGEYEVDVRRAGELVPLPQKPFEVRLVLIERQGEAVTKEEPMSAVSQNAFVEESNVTRASFRCAKLWRTRRRGQGKS